MGFIREYAFIIGAGFILALVVTVWVVRGRYCTAEAVAGTAVTVERVQTHENDIALNPLDGPTMLGQLHHHGRF